ncbi:MAG TPA: mucoidy inhibitor MuiA family protein, partial [Bacteroidetes bacterium]|nr:mucoidy inhibitor MuiA family protein [Bacteroidota bacterium]
EDKKDVSNMDDEEGMTLADYTTVSQGAVTSEFSISIPQDIPSTGQKEQVSIQNSELAALFQHYAVPKLDKDAFLVARVTGWENLNLLSGPVNIFFEGTYVTEAYLDAEITSDTLDFSLGRDKKVVIQRELLKDYNKRRSIGANRVRTFGYEITVRNTKSTPIHLQLLDQVPVSQDERITIKAIELSKAAHNEATGKLTWDLDLQPASTQKLKLIFSVKYPKKSIVPGI